MNSTKYCRKIKNSYEHQHATQQETIIKLQLLNNIKYECQTTSLKRKGGVREIFDEECKKSKRAAQLLEFGSIRRQLLNIKQEKYPKTPTCFQDIIDLFKNDNMLKEFGMSKYEENERFYIDTVIDDSFSYSIFASPAILSAIRDMRDSQSKHYIVDGTFNVVPISKQFKQLLIIHIQHADHAYPFIYVLLSHKSQSSYSHLFQYIHTNILNLNPITMITDFEASLRNSIKNVYPEVCMKNCWFHYTNALRRKASKIQNFIKNFNRDTKLKRLFTKFLILPLLKPKDIEDAFKILEEDVHTLESLNSMHLNQFLKYFKRQWMKKERPEGFSVYKEPVTTSSAAESFHSQLRMKLAKKGNFYKFMDVLTDIDAAKSADFIKSINGCTSLFKTKVKWFQRRMDFIHERLHQLKKKKITLRDILNQLSLKENCMFSENFLTEIETDDDDDSDDENNDEEYGNDEKKSQSSDHLCILCCEREREILCLPCKHCKICQQCFGKIEESSKTKGIKLLCPVCRSIVNDKMIIYV